MWLYHREMSPKDADRMRNSEDPNQTAPPGSGSSGTVWSGSTPFAQAYMSENLGSLPYRDNIHKNHMSHDMTKPTKWHVRPAKTQISLGIHPVWSVFAVCSMGIEGPQLSSCRQWRQPRLIWVFACRTVILLVLSCRSSYHVSATCMSARKLAPQNTRVRPVLVRLWSF